MDMRKLDPDQGSSMFSCRCRIPHCGSCPCRRRHFSRCISHFGMLPRAMSSSISLRYLDPSSHCAGHSFVPRFFKDETMLWGILLKGKIGQEKKRLNNQYHVAKSYVVFLLFYFFKTSQGRTNKMEKLPYCVYH